MLDRERILGKLDELEGYLHELRQIAPAVLEEYQQSIEKRRACERLLQIAPSANKARMQQRPSLHLTP
ncbi:MAG: hypothetical protein NZ610_05890 [Candidatus Bipolaricaulota bacterium]|nr:hypothetical protein [Candidatus Bipolaricaulota bacterium]